MLAAARAVRSGRRRFRQAPPMRTTPESRTRHVLALVQRVDHARGLHARRRHPGPLPSSGHSWVGQLPDPTDNHRAGQHDMVLALMSFIVVGIVLLVTAQVERHREPARFAARGASPARVACDALGGDPGDELPG